MRIHITGASGSGVSTLGKNLSQKLGIPQVECDDFYWKVTDPPFQEATDVENRKESLLNCLAPLDSWILSGSQDSWSEPFEDIYTHIIFLYVPRQVRVARVSERENQRHGSRILPGGDMHSAHEHFLKWVEQYDEGKMGGRSLSRHQNWLLRQRCPVLKIEGDFAEDEVLNKSLSFLK